MRPRPRLDVLIPTHNRAPLLERCLASVLRACSPDQLDVHITVICNACTDGSRAAVLRYQAAYPGRVSILTEQRRGKSKALNAGIAGTTGDLIGMIDDDEEVDVNWLNVIARAFEDPELDFIGGPYIPVWAAPVPDWIPTEYLAVLGAVDNGPAASYTRDFPGILKGGNAVIRRRALDKAGRYAEHLGPGAFSRLFSCEDEEMYWRLLDQGARGKYFPELVIFHYICADRLTREYYRKWCFWRGVSRGLMDRGHRMPVVYLAGVPRFLWGRAGRALLRLVGSRSRRPARDVFTDELRMWDLAGFAYGRHVYTLARFSPAKSRRVKESSGFAALQARIAEFDEITLAG